MTTTTTTTTVTYLELLNCVKDDYYLSLSAVRESDSKYLETNPVDYTMEQVQSLGDTTPFTLLLQLLNDLCPNLTAIQLQLLLAKVVYSLLSEDKTTVIMRCSTHNLYVYLVVNGYIEGDLSVLDY